MHRATAALGGFSEGRRTQKTGARRSVFLPSVSLLCCHRWGIWRTWMSYRSARIASFASPSPLVELEAHQAASPASEGWHGVVFFRPCGSHEGCTFCCWEHGGLHHLISNPENIKIFCRTLLNAFGHFGGPSKCQSISSWGAWFTDDCRLILYEPRLLSRTTWELTLSSEYA